MNSHKARSCLVSFIPHSIFASSLHAGGQLSHVCYIEGPTCSWIGVAYNVKGMSCIAAVQALVGAVKKLAADPESKDKNRIGVLLGTKQARGTKTLTHVMWVLFNLLPGKTTQKAHRHTPTALDFAVSAPAKGVTATCCFCALLSCFAHALLSWFTHALLSFIV